MISDDAHIMIEAKLKWKYLLYVGTFRMMQRASQQCLGQHLFADT
jgi:hypothetical protein